MTYPYDAVTKYYEINSTGTYTLVSGNEPKTILGVSIQQSGVDSISNVKCGTDIIVKNYGKDFPFNLVHYQCSAPIVIDKTGNDDASYVVTYIPRHENIASVTQVASISAFPTDFYKSMFTFDVLLLMCIGVIIGIWSFR